MTTAASAEPMRLSPSIASVLLKRSPLHAWQRHRLGGGEQGEQTDATRRGKLIDAMLLGSGPKIEVVQAKDWRTNAAKDQREAAEAAGRIAVLAEKFDAASSVVQAIRDRLRARGIEFSGQSQVTQVWESNGCECKGVIDHLILSVQSSAIIFDLKTVEDASDEAITRSIVAYGADVQHAAYVEGVEANNPELVGRVKMLFIFAECEAPYAVNVRALGGSLRELGERKWKRAKASWAACVQRGVWPGYEGTAPLEAKPWQLSEEMDQQLAAMEVPNVVPF